MHAHRTIPQRLGDHDQRFAEQEAIIADLLARVERLEAKPTTVKRAPAPEQMS